jgi:hypothetical protein
MSIENNTIIGFNKIYINATTEFEKRDRKKVSR